MCYADDMSPKDRTINLRVSSEWLDAVDYAATARSKQLGVPISRNAFIELAVVNYAESIGLTVSEELANEADQDAVNAELDAIDDGREHLAIRSRRPE